MSIAARLGTVAVLIALGIPIREAGAAPANRCDTPEDRAALAATSAAVQAECGCATTPNHGQYVRCSRRVIEARAASGDLPEDCVREARSCTAKSTCGRPGFVTCCRTNRRGRTTCSVKKDASKCRAPNGGSACVGRFAHCCDACTAGGCAPETVRCCTGTSPSMLDVCRDLSAQECADAGGLDLGPGTCRPGDCEAPPTTTTTAAPTTTTTAAPTTTSAAPTTTTTTTTTSTTTTAAPTCGNGTVDPGEDCDPVGSLTCPDPSSPSGALVACEAGCVCPGGSTTTTTLPGLGVRSFTLANGAHPQGSHLYSSATGGGDVATENSFVGAIALTAGGPGGDGVAPLAVASNSFIGFGVIDGSIVCARIDAAGSTGKIDCDGGTPVDVTVTQNSNGAGANDPPVVQTEQGAPGPAGSGYVVVTARLAQCPNDPSCALVNDPADCLDPGTVNYDAFPSAQGAFTTGTATATVQNASQGGNPTISVTGRPFSCASWTTDGPGVLEAPVPFLDSVVGDLANVVQLDD